MRGIDEYSLREWAMGLPMEHGFKRARNFAVERVFRASRPRDYDRFMAGLSGRSPHLIIVVAFNTPWVIDLATRMAQRNLGAQLIVCDNSRKPEARQEIEKICHDRGVPYIGLPLNPERHPCRSHGVAMNWAYYNIVLPLRPSVFGFFDHDLFVIEPLEIQKFVTDQPIYGRLNLSRWGWNLWAGFCIYRFQDVVNCAPDFNNDVPRHLDTGGRNWLRIYRHLDFDKMKFAEAGTTNIRFGDASDNECLETVDTCLHVSGVNIGSYRKGLSNQAFFEQIVRHIEDGGTLDDLRTPQSELADA
jgi:hypothetical protein